MIISTTLEALGIAALIAAYYHEDKFIKFESDCREIYRACKHQGISACDLFKMICREELKK